MTIVQGVVAHLVEVGLSDVFAYQRWRDPVPGQSVIVVTSDNLWAAGLQVGSEHPEVQVKIYSAPAAGQVSAETIGEPIARWVRASLHLPYGADHRWGSERVLTSAQVGGSLLPVPGHPTWSQRVLTFEVQTG